MKKLLVLALSLTSLKVMGQSANSIDQQSERKPTFDRAAANLEEQVENLTSFAVFTELTRLDSIRAARVAATGNWWSVDDKSLVYTLVLEKRYKKGLPAGAFYYALHQWTYCSLLQRQDGRGWEKQRNECWTQTLNAFKIASAAGLGSATFNIARQYENGYGVIASKYAAADWYIKAANQYNKTKERDEALTSLEAALAVVPDHPAALRLKTFMLN